MPESPCKFPSCPTPSDHTHHITYKPPITVRLCRKHHEDITIINGAKGRRLRHPLNNKTRWFLWYSFLSGKIKPRRTKKALEWIEKWDDESEHNENPSSPSLP